MNKGIFLRFYLLSALIVISYSCAKQGRPTGGPKDKQPPVVMETIPGNRTTGFSGKKLVITFDEYVALDNINDNLLVSPPMKKKPRVFMKGKSVVTEFEENLKDSMTYTIYFHDAIKDLNEGNILENFQFVFSTGPVIDSLSVTGYVYKADNLEVPEKTLVLMYRNMADSAVRKQLPDYISRIDYNGYFRINNVRAGEYRLYGLKDMDNSKNYNLDDEEFAFSTSTVKVTPEKNFLPVVKDTADVKKDTDKKSKEPLLLTGQYKLMLFLPVQKARYLKSSERSFKFLLTYVLSLPPDSLEFDFSVPDFTSKSYIIEKSKGKDTIRVWLTDSTLYSKNQISTIINYPFTDSLGILGYKKDTLLMRFTAPREARGAREKKSSLSVMTNVPNGLLKPGQQLVFKSSTPLLQPDTSKIRLYELRKTDTVSIRYSLIKDKLTSAVYFLKAEIQPKKKYLFIADSSSFRDIFGECSDSIGIRLSLKEAESFSKLTLNIKNGKGNWIVQLLDKSEKPLSEIRMKSDGKAVFPLLDIGTYRAKVIYDTNNDGKWSTGDFVKKKQPETVSFYPEEIEIKNAGWEVEQDWDIGSRSVKSQKLRTIARKK